VLDAFEANTQSDFLGTDKTAQCSAVLVNLGEKGLVTVTNNSGGLVYVRFNLKGYAIYETYTSDITYPTDADTIQNPRELLFDLKWMQNPSTGTDIVAVLGAFFSGLHPMPRVKVENRFDLQFEPDLFDIVSADIPKLGLIGESFRVGGIEHQTLTDNCQGIVSTFYLEPYVAGGDYWQWDVASDFDETTIFGW